MPAVALSVLRDRVRQRTDNEDEDLVTDAELNQLINARYQELYALLVENNVHRTEVDQAITATGAASYALDAGAWVIMAVFRMDGDVPVRLEKHDHRLKTDDTFVGPADTYRVIGVNIEFHPRPSDGTYYVRYVPEPGVMSADGDTMDGVVGWDEYVVVGASIDVLAKEETDAPHLHARLAKLEERVVRESRDSEMSETSAVQDVRGRRRMLPGGYRGVTGYWGRLKGF